MRNRPKYSRPDAIKIKTAGTGSYADKLRRIKTTLMALGERVTRIRRTRTNELSKNSTETPVLQSAIASSLNESTMVKSLTHKEQVTILDIDVATEVAEITRVISFVIGPDCVAPVAI